MCLSFSRKKIFYPEVYGSLKPTCHTWGLFLKVPFLDIEKNTITGWTSIQKVSLLKGA